MPACLGTERAASPGLATVVRTMRAGGAGEGMGAPGSAYEGRHPAGGFPLLFLLSRDHIALSLAFKPRDEAINFVDEMMQHHESFIVVRSHEFLWGGLSGVGVEVVAPPRVLGVLGWRKNNKRPGNSPPKLDK